MVPQRLATGPAIMPTPVILSDTERRTAQGKVEGPRHRVPCHAASRSSLVTTDTMCSIFNYPITKLPNYQMSQMRSPNLPQRPLR